MADGDDNIIIAAGDGRLDAVRAYIDAGVSPNTQDEYGYSPMHAAASYGNTEVLMYLLSVGGRVDLRDTDNDTPLHACESPECARVLLDAGADIQALNGEGFTPIQTCAEDQRPEMVEFLRAQYALRGLEVPPLDMDEGDEDGDASGDEDMDVPEAA